MNAAELHAWLVSQAPTDKDSPIYGDEEFGGDIYRNVDANEVRNTLCNMCSFHWKHVIEIGPGGGRWSRWLMGRSKQFTAVDATDAAWEHLNRAGSAFTLLISKDGRLPSEIGQPYHRVSDLVFSYDTHVHFHKELFDVSLAAMANCVATDGLLVIHHATDEGKQDHQPETPVDCWHNVTIKYVDDFLSSRGFVLSYSRVQINGFGGRIGIYRRARD